MKYFLDSATYWAILFGTSVVGTIFALALAICTGYGLLCRIDR